MVGMDDIPLAAALRPALTTVRIDTEELGTASGGDADADHCGADGAAAARGPADPARGTGVHRASACCHPRREASRELTGAKPRG